MLIKVRMEMRSYWIRVGPKSYETMLIKGGKQYRKRHREKAM